MTTILKEYEKLQRTPSGYRHSEQYNIVRELALRGQQNELFSIMTDESIEEKIKGDLLSIAGHGGSVSLKDNLHIIPFLKRLYAADKLSPSLRRYLNWLVKVHKYPITNSVDQHSSPDF